MYYDSLNKDQVAVLINTFKWYWRLLLLLLLLKEKPSVTISFNIILKKYVKCKRKLNAPLHNKSEPNYLISVEYGNVQIWKTCNKIVC